jgi:hypothetical protein
MWLSGANAVAGSVRGRASAAAKRQTAAAVRSGNRQIADFWTSALTPPKPARRKKRR